MRGYYAFNYRRYAHTVARTTPAVIVEMGFLTNPDDRALLTEQPDLIAAGLANGIIRYLNQRDPQDQAALLPPDFGVWRGASAARIDVRAGPQGDAQILLTIEADRPLIPSRSATAGSAWWWPAPGMWSAGCARMRWCGSKGRERGAAAQRSFDISWKRCILHRAAPPNNQPQTRAKMRVSSSPMPHELGKSGPPIV